MGEDKGFLSRWAQRKAAVRAGRPVAESVPVAPPPAVAVPVASPVPAAAMPPAAAAPASDPPAPAPTLDDVAQLDRGAEVGAFVRPNVDPQVRNAALKKLFADPHFNVMDGLDVYIDDYGRPDPLPASMLRQLAQSRALGLFQDESDDEKTAAAPRQAVVPPSGADPDGVAAAAAPQSSPELDLPSDSLSDLPHDDDAAVRLQPDDAAGPPGLAGGAGPDAGRQR